MELLRAAGVVVDFVMLFCCGAKRSILLFDSGVGYDVMFIVFGSNRQNN